MACGGLCRPVAVFGDDVRSAHQQQLVTRVAKHPFGRDIGINALAGIMQKQTCTSGNQQVLAIRHDLYLMDHAISKTGKGSEHERLTTKTVRFGFKSITMMRVNERPRRFIIPAVTFGLL